MVLSEHELYNKFEKDHWWFKSRRNILSTFIREVLDKNEITLLEVGCGSGGNLKYLFRDFENKSGIDISDEAIAFSRNKLGEKVRIEYGNANELFKIRERYDFIAFLDVLYHKKILDVDNVIKSAYDILNDGGFIFISDGAFNLLRGKHSEAVNCARRFTKGELVNLLESNNFTVTRVCYWGFFLFFLIFLKRKVIDFLFPLEKENDIEIRESKIDSFLYWLVNWESYWLRFFPLPFGASIAVLARKDGGKNAV